MILSWFPIKRPMNESMRTKARKKGRVAWLLIQVSQWRAMPYYTKEQTVAPPQRLPRSRFSMTAEMRSHPITCGIMLHTYAGR
jgi:hypothetical protein